MAWPCEDFLQTSEYRPHNWSGSQALGGFRGLGLGGAGSGASGLKKSRLGA